MLNFWGSRRSSDCEGTSRRDFLKVGTLAAGALSLSELLRLKSAAADGDAEGEKWTSLFNGRDLTGWRAFLDPKAKIAAEKLWSVRDGAIICDGTVQGYLATKKEFENYVLRLEWRWGPKVTPQRYSSVFVHVTGPDKIWPKGADLTLGAGGVGQFWLVDGFRIDLLLDSW
jgi:hypothetical protein